MRKPMIAALLVAGLTSTAPVMAQDWNGYRGNHYGNDHYRPVDYRGAGDYRGQCDNNRAQRLYFRIRRGVQDRAIDWHRAQDLRAAVNRTAEMQRNFCARGLNNYQASRLDRQWDRVEDMVNREARG